MFSSTVKTRSQLTDTANGADGTASADGPLDADAEGSGEPEAEPFSEHAASARRRTPDTMKARIAVRVLYLAGRSVSPQLRQISSMPPTLGSDPCGTTAESRFPPKK